MDKKGESFKRLAGDPASGVERGQMHIAHSLGSATLNYGLVAQGGLLPTVDQATEGTDAYVATTTVRSRGHHAVVLLPYVVAISLFCPPLAGEQLELEIAVDAQQRRGGERCPNANARNPRPERELLE